MTNEIQTISYEEQIKLLELRIAELELEKNYLQQKDDRPFDHKHSSIDLSIGLTKEQHDELCSVVEIWVNKMFKNKDNPSTVFERIYKSPLMTREKMLMTYIFGIYMQDILSKLRKA